MLHFTWLIWIYLNFTLIHLTPNLLKTSFNCYSILYTSVTPLKHAFNIHKLVFFSIALLSRISVVGGFHCCGYSCVCGDRSLLQHYEALTRNEYQHSVVSACLGFCSVSFSVLLNPPLCVPNRLHHSVVCINLCATDGWDTNIFSIWKKNPVCWCHCWIMCMLFMFFVSAGIVSL